MQTFRDNAEAMRFEEEFEGGRVIADYARRGEVRALLHVEADPGLRGSGAAGRFMESLAQHARAEGLKLTPVCGYAVAWLKRHPEHADLIA